MRKLTALLVVLIVILLSTPAFAHRTDKEHSHEGRKPHAPATAYESDKVLGWELHVHEDLFANKELYGKVRGEVYHQLFRITRLISEDKVALLKKVPIWLELENPYSSGCQYHPEKDWLLKNGYLGEKAKCVDIGNANNFLRVTRTSQPYVMLHELAHAYHDQILSFDHEGVIKAFEEAAASGKYEEVMHINGRTVRHYALSNHKEYFAEITEAYFGTNDFYPYVRSELKEHDPEGYALLEAIWGK